MSDSISAAPAQTTGRTLGDAKAVGRKFTCHWRTILRLADSGRIPWGFKLNGLRRWDMTELDEFIANGCKPVRTATAKDISSKAGHPGRNRHLVQNSQNTTIDNSRKGGGR